jgi:hypothetical protein
VVTPLSLPSLGVSSLDLGRLRQRKRSFFLAQQDRSMIDVVAAVLGLFSAGIFLAHAVEAAPGEGQLGSSLDSSHLWEVGFQEKESHGHTSVEVSRDRKGSSGTKRDEHS